MKIYLDNVEPRHISKKFKDLHVYYRDSKKIMELVSNNGIFHVENNKFYKLKPVDKPIKKIQENVIVDESYFEREQVYSQIPTEYLSSLMTVFIYSFHEKSKLKLHVEGYYKNISVNNKKIKAIPNIFDLLVNETQPLDDLDKRYHSFAPVDFYFCIGEKDEKIDKYLESTFFNEELKEWIHFLLN